MAFRGVYRFRVQFSSAQKRGRVSKNLPVSGLRSSRSSSTVMAMRDSRRPERARKGLFRV